MNLNLNLRSKQEVLMMAANAFWLLLQISDYTVIFTHFLRFWNNFTTLLGMTNLSPRVVLGFEFQNSFRSENCSRQNILLPSLPLHLSLTLVSILVPWEKSGVSQPRVLTTPSAPQGSHWESRAHRSLYNIEKLRCWGVEVLRCWDVVVVRISAQLRTWTR